MSWLERKGRLHPPDENTNEDAGSGISEKDASKLIAEDSWLDILSELEDGKMYADLVTDSLKCNDFKVLCRQGAWTLLHTGVLCDAVRGQAVSKNIKQWLKRYGLNKSKTCYFSAYNDNRENCTCLVMLWCLHPPTRQDRIRLKQLLNPV